MPLLGLAGVALAAGLAPFGSIPLPGLLLVAAGGLAGAQFSAACRWLGNPGRVYGADLLGSALGAAVAGAFLLPALGTRPTCLVTACCALAAWAVLNGSS